MKDKNTQVKKRQIMTIKGVNGGKKEAYLGTTQTQTRQRVRLL